MIVESLDPPDELGDALSVSFTSFSRSSPPWAVVLLSTATAGDLSAATGGFEQRRQRVAEGTWYTTQQVHGSKIARAGSPSPARADAMVVAPGNRLKGYLAMFSADCPLVAAVSPEGVVGIAHCGWRGLEMEVLQELGAAMRDEGASTLAAVRSPCIGPECYEFGGNDLARLVERYGSAVSARTRNGRLALDLRAGVRSAACEAGIGALLEVNACTSCDPGWFSFRARRESARFALAIGTGP